MSKELSDKEISAGARWLCDQSADACGVNREDNWNIYGNEYIHEFRGAYNAAVKVSPATANKAAEEGELPAIPEELSRYYGYYGWQDYVGLIHGYVQLAIAADRASRQVANKAEVDDGMFSKEWKAGYSVAFETAKKLFATPPATTGASTAREAVLDEVIDALTKRFVVKDEPWVAIGIVRALKGSVGASTVLTDERIEALREYANPKNWTLDSEGIARIWLEPGSSTPDCYAGFELASHALASPEVAAQAGQVAVPEGWKLVPINPMLVQVHAGLKADANAHHVTDIYTAMVAAALSPAKESK